MSPIRRLIPMTTRDVGAERDAAIAALEAFAREAQVLADFLRTHPDVNPASAQDVRVAETFFHQLQTTSRALIAWQRRR
jgi:lactam utilization protein B